MKAQKLGLVLGINMVAACLMMQGCAAPDSEKAKRQGKYPPSATGNRVTVISRPAPVSRQLPPPAQPQALPPQPVQPQALPPQPVQPEPVFVATPTPAPAPVVQDPPPLAPSSVRTVKKLPAVPPKKPKFASAPSKPASAPAKGVASSGEVAAAEYVVQPGDTISRISKKTNYREEAILAANPSIKSKDRIIVGQKIKLPGAVAAPVVAKAPAPATKDVAAKDDAAKDNVKLASAPAPAAANTVAPVKTKGGFVPYEGPTKDYVVKSGDSMGQIAVSYGISIRALKALNGLKGDALRAGQKLKVPVEKQTSATVAPAKPAVAAKGDGTAPAPAVKEAAAPAPAPVAAAAKPAAPAKAEEPAKKPEEAAKVEVAAPPAEESASALPTHTVKDGEDLVSIAIAYGISPSALMDINDLKPTDEVKPGQRLNLPANAKQ